MVHSETKVNNHGSCGVLQVRSLVRHVHRVVHRVPRPHAPRRRTAASPRHARPTPHPRVPPPLRPGHQVAPHVQHGRPLLPAERRRAEQPAGRVHVLHLRREDRDRGADGQGRRALQGRRRELLGK